MVADEAGAGRRRGVIYGLGAYAVWGMMPAYVRLIHTVPPLQIVAHRAIWTAVLTAFLLFALRRGGDMAAALRRPRVLLMLVLSALLIGINWLAYSWAVLNGHVLAASLGYFINPLVNVALGVFVLKERLRRPELVAVGLAAVGVLALINQGAAAVWIPLAIALSFGVYGLVRKIAAVGPLEGLTFEVAVLTPLSLIFLFSTARAGSSAFGADVGTDLLLIAGGVITAVPLLLFAAAAKRMPYSALGVLQYLGPTMQFIQAVLLFGEEVTATHAFTFLCIWSALAVFAWDTLRRDRVAEPVCPPE